MERWRRILKRWGPRRDGDSEFYPDGVENEGPVLLNEAGPMAAAFVGARVLRAVVARRGTVLRPAFIERLEKLLARGLSEEVVHHCEAEAELILEWIAHAPPVDEPEALVSSTSPELDMMMAADLESRLSVARFALDEGYDLELEYFDEDSRTWPRIRASLEGIEGVEAADFQTTLELMSRDGEIDVALKHVRWLMPVPARPIPEPPERPGGEVVEFPGGRNEN